MMDEDEFVGEEPYKEAKDYGFDDSVFLLNSGEMISSSLVMTAILPIAILLMKCKNQRIAGYFYDIARSYRWSFFIRAWIEIYLEICVAAFL